MAVKLRHETMQILAGFADAQATPAVLCWICPEHYVGISEALGISRERCTRPMVAVTELNLRVRPDEAKANKR